MLRGWCALDGRTIRAQGGDNPRLLLDSAPGDFAGISRQRRDRVNEASRQQPALGRVVHRRAGVVEQHEEPLATEEGRSW